MLNKREEISPWTAKIRSQDLRGRQKHNLTNIGEGLCVLVPLFLHRSFLLVFPIYGERDCFTITLPWDSRENHFTRCER